MSTQRALTRPEARPVGQTAKDDRGRPGPAGLPSLRDWGFSVERCGAASIVDQIVTRLTAAIQDGALAPGVRLPSIRSLARRLGVSTHSVVEAYDRLAANGLVLARAGTGVFVTSRPGSQDSLAPAEPDTAEPLGLALAAMDSRGAPLSPGNGYLPTAWVEDAWTGPALARFQRRLATALPVAAPPQGSEELREQIAAKLRTQGIFTASDCLLITFGASHALELVMRSHLVPGDTVLVEDPGYFMLFPMLERHGAQVLPVERRFDGPDLDAVETACRRYRPKLLFMQSVLHNPTGWTATPANLHRLLGIAERHGLLIVEDDAYGDLHPGNPVRLVQLGGGDHVVYVSGFTKTLGPGARIGFLTASRDRLETLLRAKVLSVLTGAHMDELLVLEVLSSGQYRRYLDRLRPRLAAARAAVARQLAEIGMEAVPDGEPGLFIWARVPDAWQVGRLVEEAYRRGVLLARGDLFRPGRLPSSHLRFNVARSNDARLFALLRDVSACCTSA